MTIKASPSANGPAIGDEIDDLHRKLETLAQNGKWSELTALMQRRDELLPKVTDIDRAVVSISTVRANDRVLKLVRAQRQGIADQLTTMCRGCDMTGHYASHREAPNTTQ